MEGFEVISGLYLIKFRIKRDVLTSGKVNTGSRFYSLIIMNVLSIIKSGYDDLTVIKDEKFAISIEFNDGITTAVTLPNKHHRVGLIGRDAKTILIDMLQSK